MERLADTPEPPYHAATFTSIRQDGDDGCAQAATWKKHPDHQRATARVKDCYRYFRVRVCRVEREYGF